MVEVIKIVIGNIKEVVDVRKSKGIWCDIGFDCYWMVGKENLRVLCDIIFWWDYKILFKNVK